MPIIVIFSSYFRQVNKVLFRVWVNNKAISLKSLVTTLSTSSNRINSEIKTNINLRLPDIINNTLSNKATRALSEVYYVTVFLL